MPAQGWVPCVSSGSVCCSGPLLAPQHLEDSALPVRDRRHINQSDPLPFRRAVCQKISFNQKSISRVVGSPSPFALVVPPSTPAVPCGSPPRIIPKGSGLWAQDAQAACGFRYWASKCTPFFQTVKVMAAILRARVRRASASCIPLASKLS